MEHKMSISQFLNFVRRGEKQEKVEIRAGKVDKRQALMWTDEEEMALFFLLKRHGYNSTRTKNNKINKKMKDNPDLTSRGLIEL